MNSAEKSKRKTNLEVKELNDVNTLSPILASKGAHETRELLSGHTEEHPLVTSHRYTGYNPYTNHIMEANKGESNPNNLEKLICVGASSKLIRPQINRLGYGREAASLDMTLRNTTKLREEYCKSQEFSKENTVNLGSCKTPSNYRKSVLLKHNSSLTKTNEKVRLEERPITTATPQKVSPDLITAKNQMYKIPSSQCEFTHYSSLFCQNRMCMKCKNHKEMRAHPQKGNYVVQGSRFDQHMRKLKPNDSILVVKSTEAGGYNQPL